MWTCPNCERIFEKIRQPHSCKKISLGLHFKNKDKAKELFEYLVKQVNEKVGKYKIISVPCCIHLFGKYDFLAALPKKNGLEIRFALGRKLSSQRLKQFVPLSAKVFKHCFEITSEKEIDDEFIEWLKESYHLKD
ncbi:MAG: DUF5655 domain-containing protein [Patescibacteria group bacterium]|jgi:hypothetical protein